MTKQKKLIIIIVSCILAVALITTAVILIIANNNREKTATTILTCKVNPQVQFVLNGNDKVMKVVALNSDGQEIAINGDFVGLKADDATELFIKLGTEAGHIDLNTTGTEVSIHISGLKDNYKALKDNIVDSVNKYFDENGIIAGAKATIDEDIKNSILTIKSTAHNMENKSDEDLIAHYLEIVDLIQGKNAGDYGVDANQINFLFSEYDKATQKYENEIEQIESALASKKAELAQLQEDLKALTSQTEIAAINSLIAQVQQNINSLEGMSLTQMYNTYVNTPLNLVYTAIRFTAADIEKIKTDFASHISNFADDLAEHREAFNADKAAVQAKIDAYRATLNA